MVNTKSGWARRLLQLDSKGRRKADDLGYWGISTINPLTFTHSFSSQGLQQAAGAGRDEKVLINVQNKYDGRIKFF